MHALQSEPVVAVGSLESARVLVPESRELDLFAAMLEREGALVIRCPLIRIRDIPDTTLVEQWLQRLASHAFSDVVLLTGEGVTRLAGYARRIQREGEMIQGLERARKIVRGPKPTRALRALGLSPDLAAAVPTTDGVIETLSKLDLRGHSVGVQAYPEMPTTLLEFLAEAGAEAQSVCCYEYVPDSDDEEVTKIIRMLASGEVDLIAFTSSPQIRRLQEVAQRAGLHDRLTEAMSITPVAAIGPVTAEAAREAGWHVTVIPRNSFHLKPLIAAILNDRKLGREKAASQLSAHARAFGERGV